MEQAFKCYLQLLILKCLIQLSIDSFACAGTTCTYYMETTSQTSSGKVRFYIGYFWVNSNSQAGQEQAEGKWIKDDELICGDIENKAGIYYNGDYWLSSLGQNVLVYPSSSGGLSINDQRYTDVLWTDSFCRLETNKFMAKNTIPIRRNDDGTYSYMTTFYYYNYNASARTVTLTYQKTKDSSYGHFLPFSNDCYSFSSSGVYRINGF